MRKSVIFLSNHLTVSDSAKDEFPLIFDHYLDEVDDATFFANTSNEYLIFYSTVLGSLPWHCQLSFL